jgi:hypothetical protein
MLTEVKYIKAYKTKYVTFTAQWLEYAQLAAAPIIFMKYACFSY